MPDPVTFALGVKGKIYQGPAGMELASLNEMANVKDVTVTLGASEAPITTRAGGGWDGTVTTLGQCSAEFEMLWRPDDPRFAAMLTAYLTRGLEGLVRLALLTGDKDVAGSQGPVGDFSVTGFNRSETLEGVITAAVTVKLAMWGEWKKVE